MALLSIVSNQLYMKIFKPKRTLIPDNKINDKLYNAI